MREAPLDFLTLVFFANFAPRGGVFVLRPADLPALERADLPLAFLPPDFLVGFEPADFFGAVLLFDPPLAFLPPLELFFDEAPLAFSVRALDPVF